MVCGKVLKCGFFLNVMYVEELSLITELDSSTGNGTSFATLFVAFKSTTQLYT